MRKSFNAFANRIDSCQPVQTDLARKFVIVVFYDSDDESSYLGIDFLNTRGPQYPILGPETEARFNTFFSISYINVDKGSSMTEGQISTGTNRGQITRSVSIKFGSVIYPITAT